MGWNKKKLKLTLLLLLSAVLFVSCKMSFGFSGAGSIDYSKVKSISITDFPNTAEYVYAPLGIRFNEELRDLFVRQTKLEVLNASQNADLEIEGEITEYRQYNESVAADGYASKLKLVITVNVRYTDNTNHDNDQIDQKFSAFRVDDSGRLLSEIQDVYIEEMIKEITEQIFNSTVANW